MILATGCEQSRNLDIPGEHGANVFSSRNFINWYNSHPHSLVFSDVFSKSETAIILGQGNVSLDVARMLLCPPDTLAKSDISESILRQLRESKIKRVYCVGRRFLENVSFTIKEFRDMTKVRSYSFSISLMFSYFKPIKSISNLKHLI